MLLIKQEINEELILNLMFSLHECLTCDTYSGLIFRSIPYEYDLFSNNQINNKKVKMFARGRPFTKLKS